MSRSTTLLRDHFTPKVAPELAHVPLRPVEEGRSPLDFHPLTTLDRRVIPWLMTMPAEAPPDLGDRHPRLNDRDLRVYRYLRGLAMSPDPQPTVLMMRSKILRLEDRRFTESLRYLAEAGLIVWNYRAPRHWVVVLPDPQEDCLGTARVEDTLVGLAPEVWAAPNPRPAEVDDEGNWIPWDRYARLLAESDKAWWVLLRTVLRLDLVSLLDHLRQNTISPVRGTEITKHQETVVDPIDRTPHGAHHGQEDGAQRAPYLRPVASPTPPGADRRAVTSEDQAAMAVAAAAIRAQVGPGSGIRNTRRLQKIKQEKRRANNAYAKAVPNLFDYFTQRYTAYTQTPRPGFSKARGHGHIQQLLNKSGVTPEQFKAVIDVYFDVMDPSARRRENGVLSPTGFMWTWDHIWAHYPEALQDLTRRHDRVMCLVVDKDMPEEAAYTRVFGSPYGPRVGDLDAYQAVDVREGAPS